MADFFGDSWLALLLAAVGGYLLGSINWAIIITRYVFRRDIREEGSGNAGATNVLRNHGRGPAILTTVGDVAKSMLAVLLGSWLVSVLHLGGPALSGLKDWFMLNGPLVGGYVGGFFCLLGHDFPVFYGFRGGKGVLTTLGMFLLLDWRVALICLAVFAAIVGVSRMVSLGSMLAIGCGIPLIYWMNAADPQKALFCAVAAALVEVLVVWQHRANVARIIKGTESKLGRRNDDKT